MSSFLKTIKHLTIVFLAICLVSCDNNKEKAEGNIDLQQKDVGETYVDVITLHRSVFNKQIVCNGRLRAIAKSDLSFTSQGITTAIKVKEGMHVSKGTLIATLDSRERIREVEKAEKEVERAKVELIDKLIGLGYDATLRGVPADLMQRAEVSTGYFTAKYQLQSAKTSLGECALYAPFSGRIANLDARPFQRNDKICTLIDDSRFEVEFKVLEEELKSVHVGRNVKITAFAAENQTYNGTITEINPLVDDKGLITFKARLSNRNHALLDGMNVRVIIEEQVPGMFVVPKDAIVERDGYKIIFIYKEGRAVWTYVDVLHSNINSFAIIGSRRKETYIHDGEKVITSGNLNLADGTEVKIN